MEEDSSVYSSESVTPLKHVSHLSSEVTTRERLSIYCKPSLRLRRLKNKGAILVLIWNYLCISSFFFYWMLRDNHAVGFRVQAVTLGLTLFIAGWIADVRFGRYKVIYWSMLMMWAAQMLATVSSVLLSTVDNYTSNINGYVNGVVYTIGAIGLGGFQANIIQFGMDQLHDSSTDEITSFILWYVWTYYSSGFIIIFIIGCLPKQYRIVWYLMICIYLSIALSALLLFSHWLVKEPVTRNPSKLVYSVIRYAIKHNHPECRSAFTYWEDDPPSRMDFGKNKYGGPFTTEQVEDVKTFLRLTIVMFIIMMTFSIIIASQELLFTVQNMLTDTGYNKPFSECYSIQAFIKTFGFSGVIILPLYECFFYPVFHRCLKIVNSHWKIVLGILLLLAGIIAVLVIETVARYKYLESNNYNTTIPCHGTLHTNMIFQWIAVPWLFYSLSMGVIGIGFLTFIASQAPYSMRGLIMGTLYCLFVPSLAVGIGISTPFRRQLSIWGTGIISCGFWYALLLLVIEVLLLFMFIAMHKWYKKRKREDVLPNEHIFAERYYDRDN